MALVLLLVGVGMLAYMKRTVDRAGNVLLVGELRKELIEEVIRQEMEEETRREKEEERRRRDAEGGEVVVE